MSVQGASPTLAALRATVANRWQEYDRERCVRPAGSRRPWQRPPTAAAFLPPALCSVRGTRLLRAYVAQPTCLKQNSEGCLCGCRAAQRLQDAVVRGAVAGLSLRGGLHLVGYLLQLLARRRRSKGPAGSAGRADADALSLLKDTARWGAFLGSFSGGWGARAAVECARPAALRCMTTCGSPCPQLGWELGTDSLSSLLASAVAAQVCLCSGMS